MSGQSSRREFLLATGGAAVGIGLASMIMVEPARATPAAMQEAIRKVVGSARINPGRVKLDLPPLSENGNTVPLTVSAESPMTAADHVKALHVFNEKNPQPDVASLRLRRRAGRAAVSPPTRLADTHTVLPLCQRRRGSLRSTSADVL